MTTTVEAIIRVSVRSCKDFLYATGCNRGMDILDAVVNAVSELMLAFEKSDETKPVVMKRQNFLVLLKEVYNMAAQQVNLQFSSLN